MALLIIALALVLVPLLALMVLRRPVAAGVVLLFMLYTRISDVGIAFHGLPSVAQPYILALAAVMFGMRTLSGRSRSLAASLPQWCAMGLYLVVVYASSIWAIDSGVATYQGTELLKNLLIVYIIAEIFSDPRTQRLAVWALLAAGAVLAGLTVLQAVTHTYANSYLGLAQAPIRQIAGQDNGARSSGPVGDPNFYALILIALIPLALVRVRDERLTALRLTALAITLLLLAATMLTYSRGALVTLAAMAVLFVPLLRVRARHLLLFLVVLLPLIPLVPSNYWMRIGSIAQGDDAIASRLGSEQVALAIFADHPLLGVGANNFPNAYFPYAMQLNVPDAANEAHDLYLAIGAETGLLGLLTFGGAMFLVLQLAWRRRDAAWRDGDQLSEGLATSCVLALLTYLMGCVFLPLAYPRYLWILVGLTLAVALPSERRAWDLLYALDGSYVAVPRRSLLRSSRRAWDLLYALDGRRAAAPRRSLPLPPLALHRGGSDARDGAARRTARVRSPLVPGWGGISIGKQLLQGGLLSYGSFLAGKVLTFGSTLILARLLLPRDFGLVGYALLVLSFLDVLKNLGVTAALIYRQDIGDDEAGETFVLALATAVAFSGLCWVLAPLAAQFFHNPDITLVTRILGLSFILDALGGVHATLLQKKMRFGRRFVPDILLNLTKGVVAVALALGGAGYWSLVWGQLAGISAFTLASWRLYPWRPRLRVRWASARRLFGYGLHIALVDIVGAVILNADNVIVGRSLGSAALGLYALAFTIPQMLTISLSVALSAVVFPAFARLQHDRDALRRTYLLVLRYSALALLPLGLGLCVVTAAFVHALYKPIWWPMIPVMQALSLYAMLNAVGWHAGDVYKATGRPDIQWKLDLGQAVALVPALLLGAWIDGLLGVAVARIVVIAPYSIARFWLIHRMLGVEYAAMWRAVRVSVATGIVMGAACLLVAVPLTSHAAPPVALGLQILVGAVIYGGVACALDPELRARLRQGLRASPVAATPAPALAASDQF